MTDRFARLTALAEETLARSSRDLKDWLNLGIEEVPVEVLKDRYCDAHSRFVEVDGLEIHYQDHGPRDSDKAPLLLIHGLMASLFCWEFWVPELAKDRRVVTLDIPPFAITGPHPKGSMTEAGYMKLLLEFADAVGLEKFVPVGNSLGGFLAWRLAADAPERVLAAALLDPAGGTSSLPAVVAAFKVPLVGQAYQSMTPKAAVLAGHTSMFGDPSRCDTSNLDRVFDLIMRTGARAAIQENLRVMERPDPQLMEQIECPVLLQWGEADTLLPLKDYLTGFSSRIADLSLKTYPGVGHMPMEEIPAQSLADFEKFLHKNGL